MEACLKALLEMDPLEMLLESTPLRTSTTEHATPATQRSRHRSAVHQLSPPTSTPPRGLTGDRYFFFFPLPHGHTHQLADPSALRACPPAHTTATFPESLTPPPPALPGLPGGRSVAPFSSSPTSHSLI
jgi:hypothetical protein